MKTYTELSPGNWMVTERGDGNDGNTFILVPRCCGGDPPLKDTKPELVCDGVGIDAVGEGFLVTLPSDTPSVYNFILRWDSQVRDFSFHTGIDLPSTVTQLQGELQSTQSKLETMRNLLLGNEEVNFFQLTCESPGMYYYGVNPNFDIPPELPVSINYAIISGGSPTPIPSRCPFVWGDSRGNEVIRNFYCVVDGSRILIINQDNETFMKDNLLMYTTTGTYDAGVCGIVSVQPGFYPVRLQGEGFIGLRVTARIGGSYVHSELIPVCLSGNPNYQPVGGTVEDLGSKIMASGFPQTMLNFND